MDIGVFIPIANNGWIMSATSPQYMPTFDLNKEITLKAEQYGLDFALSMIKLHGFGGKTEFWDYAMESFTLMAGLAAVTSKIKLYASVPVLAIPAPIAARMAVTIDSISHGRFGINIVSGWQKAEYDQMNIWPGPEHFLNRYEFCAEYVTVMKQLWETGQSDFKGRFLTMNECKLLPKPQAKIDIVCAGQSQTGVDFAAAHADYNFCFGMGLNEPKKCAEAVQRNPVPLDENLQGLLRACASAAGHSWSGIPSMAGHDTEVMSERWPAAMIFVPSRDGRSHTPAEFTPVEQVVPGVRVLTDALRGLAY